MKTRAAKFRKVIGIEPYNLRGAGRLAGLPGSKDHILAVTLTDNPTIKAAQADQDAAREAFHSAAGAFMPNVALEARATQGHDTLGFPQHFSEESLKVVASWDIFRGGQDTWKRVETAERYNQTTMAHARLQRDANELVDKAWAARVITADRIVKLQLQVDAAGKVITAYSKEYDLGQRSLIDLLNAENTSFNAQVSLISARSVVVFADYQLLAAMGKLLDYIRAPHPVDAEPSGPGHLRSHSAQDRADPDWHPAARSGAAEHCGAGDDPVDLGLDPLDARASTECGRCDGSAGLGR